MRSLYSTVLDHEPESGNLQNVTTELNRSRNTKNNSKWLNFTILITVTCLSLGLVAVHFYHNTVDIRTADFGFNDEDQFDKEGRFVIRNFDKAKNFASFLPGIAGAYGVPMWTFYVNRGQAIASFGVGNKDGPLEEFQSATKAYQETALTGFRTFIKGIQDGKEFHYQPFSPSSNADGISRDMMVGMNEVEITEANPSLGLATSILYFQLPGATFPGLVRKLTFSNLRHQELNLEILDGPVKFLPLGVSDFAIKSLPTTEEAWFKVYNMENDPTLPFYHESASTADTDIVTPVTKGNFAISWLETGERLPYIADPSVVFGYDLTLLEAREFLDSDLDTILKTKQSPIARTPVALSGSKLQLDSNGDEVTIYSLYGTAQDLDTLVHKIVPVVTKQGYIESKRAEAKKLVKGITDSVQTETSNPIFDAYVRQNFLDNILRGGLPVLLGNSEETSKVYHIFSRIHGDLERDYNAFYVDPTFLSQGPGNFRDVNQNRRTEVLTFPEIGDENVRFFYSLIQADGYNPLTVSGSTWYVSPEDQAEIFEAAVFPGDATTLAGLATVLKDPQLTPGKLATFAAMKTLKVTPEELVNIVADKAVSWYNANFGEGYWSDHWSYNLDLIDSYLAVYPDKEQFMLWDSKPIKFYLSPVYVLPRSLKYVLLNGQPRQVKPVVYKNPADGPPLYWPCPTWQCIAGTNSSHFIPWKSYEVPIITKVVLLAVVKFSMLDPFGMGVEMEGGKPGWLDALNGLPSLFGSSMPDAFELYKTIEYLNSVLRYGRGVVVPEELSNLMNVIHQELTANLAGGADFSYWDVVRTGLEKYRAAVTGTFKGSEELWTVADLGDLFNKMLAKMDVGFARAIELNEGATPTYFSWTATEYDVLDTKYETSSNVVVKGMIPKALPLYLEGSVRHFKVLKTREAKEALYNQVVSSPLRDEELKMYKICEDLKNQDPATGRIKAFPRGWLENESIWLHMSYKFYLEILRAGMFQEFWHEAQTGIVAFMDPSVYGRSPLEASSFLVSSAFADANIHGQGFVSRLSGSTAEFNSMWHLIMAGPNPFKVDGQGQLTLTFSPALPDFLFTSEGTVSFLFLGSVRVTYHNPENQNTWDASMSIKSLKLITSNGKAILVTGGTLNEPYSKLVRDKLVESVDVFF
jgi:hypothetical protein